jgi:CubicO group peptidase (beta-lactamase class C family)
MKLKSKLFLALLAALALSFNLLSAGLSRPIVAASSHAQNADALAARIQRVETGLLTAIVLKGEPAAPMKLAERLAHYKVPGVSIAVINNYEIEWARGYGLKETGGSEPVTVETRFQAASISKPVAALGALFLVEQGKLDLDEDVNRKLKSWQVPENEFTKERKVTLRGLVTHSAGLTVHGFRGYAAGEDVPSLTQLLDGQKPANSAPIRVNIAIGSQWRYSGGGYSVMQQMMMDVTGKPFPELMQEAVLSKLGMKHSTYQQPLPKEWWAAAATGHRATGELVKGKWHTYPEMAAAGLWTTPSDLARFAIELQKSQAGKSNQVISAALAQQMLRPQFRNWGLGPSVEGEGRAARFSHGGSNEGFRCVLVAFSETGQGAAIMTNSDNGGPLISEILRGIAREYGWSAHLPEERTRAKVDPKIYDAYAGQYEVMPGMAVTVSKEQDRLFAHIPGQPPAELHPESEITFFTVTGGFRITFVKDEQGRVTEAVVQPGGQERRAKKIK